MTPAERALLIAMARIVCEGHGRIRLLRMIEAVTLEDAKRPVGQQMPPESLEEYNARIAGPA